MTEQPYAPQIASESTLATKAVRSHTYVALRDALPAAAVDRTAVTLPDDGGPITVRLYGRTIEITTRDVTDQL